MPKQPVKSKTSLGKKLASKVKAPSNKPLWDGPCSDSNMGGVTQSMLSRYLVCKERFRINTIEGLYPVEGFNKSLEYGNMWHVCEEHFQDGDKNWDKHLQTYVWWLQKKYPMQQAEIVNWCRICLLQFPIYIKFWEKHPDVLSKTPLFQEEVFKVPFTLPSGRIVFLRGKFDSVDLIGKGKAVGIYLQENKTKSGPNEQQIKRQLSFDLQTMIYLIALENLKERYQNGEITSDGSKRLKDFAVKGVRYNVIKRPLQYQGKKETAEEFYTRLAGIIEKEPADWFMRWTVDISQEDLDKFKTTCLIPELENLCDDYEWWSDCLQAGRSSFNGDYRRKYYPDHTPHHARRPFGVYDTLAEGGSTDLDEYLATGSRVGLHRQQTLFSELEE